MRISSRNFSMFRWIVFTGLWVMILSTSGILFLTILSNLDKSGRKIYANRLSYPDADFDKSYQEFERNLDLKVVRMNQELVKDNENFDSARDNQVDVKDNVEKSKEMADIGARRNRFVDLNPVNSRKLNNVASINANQEYLDKLPVDERDYFKMRETRVNPFDFKFHYSAENLCDRDNPPFLLLTCLTTYYDIDKRLTIRKTWGSVATTGTWPGIKKTMPPVKLLFLLGGPIDSQVKRAILEDETERYGDVAMADFVDSYTNLTYKVMMAVKWTHTYCPGAGYMVKVDQDMFLHVANLIKYLQSIDAPDPGIVLGYVNHRARVFRAGKWGVSYDVYPMINYPNYTNGNSYVIAGKAISRMLYAAEHMPYVFIEDAFLTGIVRTAAGVHLVHHNGFAKWADPVPRLCSFHNPFRIAATNTDDKLKTRLWNALHTKNLKNCYHPVLRHREETV